MTNNKNTKRALISSVFALILCFAMLLGTTYAWFTDSVTSANNIIQSGSLKIDLIHNTDEGDISIKDNADHLIFDYAKWEPGYTQVETLTIVNKGTLALKYKLTLDAAGAVNAKTGEKLSDVIDVYVCEGESTANSAADLADETWTKLGILTDVLDMDGVISGNLLPQGAEKNTEDDVVEQRTFTIALHMQESAGNVYQDLSLGKVSVKLLATQYDYEEDAFGPEYDEGLDPAVNYVSTFAELKAAARNGGRVALNADISITDKSEFFYGSYVTAVYNDMILDLNGHSITVDVPTETVAAAPVLFYVYAEGASLTIVGDGDVIAKNDAFLVFPRGVSEGVYIYGGNYYNVDNTSGTKNDINAIIYSQTNSNIHIYGGTFTFKNVNGHCGGFNVYDNNGAEIVLYEGVLLSNSNYYKGSDADEIHLAEGCRLAEVTIQGETWYKVVSEEAVTNTTELNNAITNAVPGDTIVFGADVDYGSTQLAIDKAITLDLNGCTLTTANNWGGITLKNGASIKNGTINHTGNTAAIKAFQVDTIENVTINVTPTEGKVKGGIVVQSGAETYIESLKNVTITGATNGIETYNCGNYDRAKKVIGSMENVVIDATNTGILLSAPIGTATNCDIKGAEFGINMLLKGEYNVAIELDKCTVTGGTAGIYAHDEVGIPNTTNCSLNLTYDAETVINGGLIWEFEDECLGVVTLNKPV